jgi:hypothetical protein
MSQISRTTCSDELKKEVLTMRNTAIFGASSIGQGPWRPGKRVWTVALVGGSEVDFRQAQLDEGITNVTSLVIFGTSKIVVLPEMPATLTGPAILGTKRTRRSGGKDIPPVTAKGLRIGSFTLLGTLLLTDKP